MLDNIASGSMVLPSLSLQKEKSLVVTLEQGVARMAKDWREKLWIEFKRDRSSKKDLMKPVYLIEDNYEELNGDIEELRLDKNSCTEEFLTRLLEYIREFDKSKLKTPLFKLELAKVLLTGPKTNLLAQILSLQKC